MGCGGQSFLQGRANIPRGTVGPFRNTREGNLLNPLFCFTWNIVEVDGSTISRPWVRIDAGRSTWNNLLTKPSTAFWRLFHVKQLALENGLC